MFRYQIWWELVLFAIKGRILMWLKDNLLILTLLLATEVKFRILKLNQKSKLRPDMTCT